MALTIKFYFNDTTRRLTLESDPKDLKELRGLVAELFKEELRFDFNLKYLDDEGDKISMSHPLELKEALSLTDSEKVRILRLYICEKSPAPTLPGSGCPFRRRKGCGRAFGRRGRGFGRMHHAKCDVCNEMIVGKRYKCNDCPDYDHCETCRKLEGVHNPSHTFTQIERPRHWGKGGKRRHRALCDVCTNVIVGKRYKCNDCADYDHCETCRKLEGVHDPSHTFTEIERPLHWGRNGRRCQRGVGFRRFCLGPLELTIESAESDTVKKEEQPQSNEQENVEKEETEKEAKKEEVIEDEQETEEVAAQTEEPVEGFQHSEALSALLSMGFPEELSKLYLLRRKGDLNKALADMLSQ
eukprot:TRINITY_DN1200_c0_g1_i1.p1 TRINITY_DN1200_c0_g1~~TRINITY_DN1200_c0_g1_i1.p1  ORF type:complete len:355 (+),score=59.47 TRINITY_DN1200_c0_g1_i1:72-1136(+)